MKGLNFKIGLIMKQGCILNYDCKCRQLSSHVTIHHQILLQKKSVTRANDDSMAPDSQRYQEVQKFDSALLAATGPCTGGVLDVLAQKARGTGFIPG